MGKVLIWFVIIISTVVLYCLMKVKAESDELYLDKVFYDHRELAHVGFVAQRGRRIDRRERADALFPGAQHPARILARGA